MGKLGFYFDATMCTGCRTCQVACKDKNRLDIGTLFRQVKDYEVGSYPDVTFYHLTMSCNHCEDPACVTACPYGAPKYMEEQQKVGKCDGCAAIRAAGGNPVCVDACPLRALEFGDVEELKKKHTGEDLVSDLPILPSSEATGPNYIIHAKASMLKDGAEEMYL